MYKSPLAIVATVVMTLLLVTACAEEGKQAATVEKAESPVAAKTKVPATQKTNAPAAQKSASNTPKAPDMDAPIMNQPVDFSTPESVAKTLQAVSEQAGPRAAKKIESVMGYMMTYDLGVGRDEAKMLKKLDGKTPNQIIAMGSARG